MTKIHLIERTLHVISVDPEHPARAESETFRRAKERLEEDGHHKCWICGTTEGVQIHHFIAEYYCKDLADLDKMKAVAEAFDPYGYGRLLRDKPFTDPEDIRGMLALCQKHHTGIDHTDGGMGTGIHSMDFPTFMLQKVARDGLDPVPQSGETAQQAIDRITKGAS